MKDADLAMLREALTALPYVRAMGLDAGFEQDELICRLNFAEHLIGNPLLPALHGGVVGALLHFTATAQLMLELRTHSLPRVSTASIEYLASPGARTSYASATIISRSRRFAGLRAVAWQQDRASPVAAGSLQFLIG